MVWRGPEAHPETPGLCDRARIEPFWLKTFDDLQGPCGCPPHTSQSCPPKPRHPPGHIQGSSGGSVVEAYHRVPERGRDFAADALKRGCSALQREWVRVATSPGHVERGARNGQVPSQFQHMGSMKRSEAQRGGRI